MITTHSKHMASHPMFMGSHSVASISCPYLDEGGLTRRELVLVPGSLSHQGLPVADLCLLPGAIWALIVPGERPTSIQSRLVPLGTKPSSFWERRLRLQSKPLRYNPVSYFQHNARMFNTRRRPYLVGHFSEQRCTHSPHLTFGRT